jgi:DNA recombination protein RmuC
VNQTVIFVLGAFVGGVIGWLWSSSRSRASLGSELTTLHATIGARDSTIIELRTQITERTNEVTTLRTDLDGMREARTVADTKYEEALRLIEQQKTWLTEAQRQLKDTFSALSADALRNNTTMFTSQTEEKVKPLLETLERYENEIRRMEAVRQTAYGSVTTELQFIRETHQELHKQTTNLVTALRSPQVKGRWGEITLKRVVEVAGMCSHCDFQEQVSVETESGKLRPDLIVTLPGVRTIVIDSKVPLAAYLEAVDAPDEDSRRDCLIRHARSVRGHMSNLSGKAYWSQFTSTPDFVVMFLPGEAFFSAALETDRSLIEDGIQERVILATPTTLIALLRTVAYSWQEKQVAENAQRIAEAGRELFDRVCKFAEHLGKVGDGLRKATETYNAAVSSWTNRVVPSGRRMNELGVVGDREMVEMGGVEVGVRLLDPEVREAEASAYAG